MLKTCLKNISNPYFAQKMKSCPKKGKFEVASSTPILKPSY